MKILYGVAGEGMGHATRSEVVIEHLRKKHQVKVFSAARAFKHLKSKGPAQEIDYFKIVYHKNTAANFLTFLNNIVRLPLIIKRGWKVKKAFDTFRPDVVITDFEPLVVYFAKFYSVPVVSIDNQHVITDAYHGSLDKGYGLAKLATLAVIRCFIPFKKKKVGVTYFPVTSRKKETVFVKPLIRKEIQKLRPVIGKHLLVYQTSTSNHLLQDELLKLSLPCIVYGFNKDEKRGNVIFKKMREKAFYEDLRTCKAVLTNGGFGLISEALYLNKPICSIPVEQQYEQILNALYLNKLGYGEYHQKASARMIQKFLSRLSTYRKKMKEYKRYTNAEALKKVDEFLIPSN